MPADNPIFHYEALEYAEEFYGAYKQLRAGYNITTSWPRYLLLCQAVELGLKAFLARFGVPEGELRKPPFGHKIEQLIAEALERGLNIGTRAESEIKLLHRAHARHWARYPRPPQESGEPVFVIEDFEPYVRELLEAVSKSIRGS